MKSLGQCSPLAAPLAVALSLLLSSGTLRASGPGGVGGASSGGTTGAASAGMSAGGGAHGGAAVSSSGGHSFAASAVGGGRSGVSFANSGARSTASGFSPAGIGRANVPVGFRPAANVPTIASAPRTVYRPTNAWSGTAVGASENSAARGSSRQLYTSNGYTNNRFAGRASSNTYNNGLATNRWSDNGNNRGRGRYPYRYNNYPYNYGPYYAPYIDYDGGGYYGAYPYTADVTAGDVTAGYNNGTATANPQYTDQGQDAANDQQTPAQQPAPQNQDGNNTANASQSAVPNNGPDSLVQAVQEELIRRGYFGGKVDAMYGPDTKEALRKFQRDHHLADSGLINEATLHALQLD